MSATSLDACLKLIAERRRRRIIDLLRNNGKGRTTIDELVTNLNGGGRTTSTERPPDGEALASQVYHTHVPKLADFGVVDYDHERGTVQYLPHEQLEAVLDSLPEGVPQRNP